MATHFFFQNFLYRPSRLYYAHHFNIRLTHRNHLLILLTTITQISKKKLQVVYSIAKPHRDIYLVIRVDRLLSVDTSAEMYMKTTNDLKGVAKLQKIIQQISSKSIQDKMPFAWAARFILLLVIRKLVFQYVDYLKHNCCASHGDSDDIFSSSSFLGSPKHI